MATILVCDDKEGVRSLIRHEMEEEGHVVIEAENGIEVLALASQTRPDLVILDLVLPGRSGLEVLQSLRRQEALATVPVLLLTGARIIADEETAASFGADAFLPKPFERTELRRTVRELLAGAGECQDES
jgi:DNA-binding response OmpR family regulator